MISIVLSVCMLASVISVNPLLINAAETTNVALGKTAYASTDLSEWGAGASKLTDGDTNAWSSEFSSHTSTDEVSQWAAVDLDKAYIVNQVTLCTNADQGLPSEFSILAYNGSKWVEVYHGYGPGEIASGNPLFFDAVTCNAIKVVASRPSNRDGSYVFRLSELQVFGVESDENLPKPNFDDETTNVALASNETIITNASTHSWAEPYRDTNKYGMYNSARIIDGVPSFNTGKGFWYGDRGDDKQTTPLGVTLAFDNTYRIHKISLEPAYTWTTYEGGFPEDFTIEALTTEGWKMVVSKSGFTPKTNGATNDFYFSDIDCTAVRLTTSKNGAIGTDSYGLNLGEFAVYGEAAGRSKEERNKGKLSLVPYNNESAIVDLATGMYAFPVVVDENNDGYMDLVVSSLGNPYNRTYVFYGSDKSRDASDDGYLLLDKGKYLMAVRGNFTASYLYDANGEYKDTIVQYGTNVCRDFQISCSWTDSIPTINPPSTINGISYNIDGLRWNGYGFADVDGDSNLDVIRTISTMDKYGWAGKYDSNGVWGADEPDGAALHTWVLWSENLSEGTGTPVYQASYGEPKTVNVLLGDNKIEALDVYGAFSSARFYDFDKDGDLDVIVPSFMDDIYYFENISNVENSNLNSDGMFLCAPGKNIKLSNGANTSGLADLQMELCMITITDFDWNSDGHMDLIVGEEDGRVALLENTGLLDEDDIPIFHEPKYFKTPADDVKTGIFNTPCSVDWDGDGDEDIIIGDSAGFISLIENVTPEGGDLSNPSWAAPVRLTDQEGNTIRHQAGYNGSVQGPDEEKYGYTVMTVADWDGDGVLDIMANGVWGKVVWYRGIKGETQKVYAAQPVTVEWENGTKYPAHNWWKPNGNELVTFWRTTPFMIDLNKDGLTDLVMCDHEGYMALYERFDDNGTLKLKEGQRIFFNEDSSPMILAEGTDPNNGIGTNRQKFVLTDWNGDGKLDMIKNDGVSVRYWENIAIADGAFVFKDCGTMYNLQIVWHTTSPTVCDWNKDGKPEVLVGAEDGHLYYLSRENSIDDTALSEHLVAHYDFEGDNPLADKATSGEVTDDLSVNSESLVTINDGTATITGTGALYAKDSVDLSQTDGLTVFFRAKFSGSMSSSSNIIDKRAFGSSNGGENRSFGIYVSEEKLNTTFSANPGTGDKYHSTATVAVPKDVWREYAFVIRKGTDGYLDSYLYMSKDETAAQGDDFSLIASNTSGKATNLSDSHAPLVIGNNVTFSDLELQQTFDDVRIYDSALPTHQLSRLLPSQENHAITHFEAIKPSCKEGGRIEYWYCSDCEGYWLDAACTMKTDAASVLLPKTDEHKEVVVKGKAATCTKTGLTDGKKCSVCGVTTVAQKTIAKKGHKAVTVKGKAATCTKTGLTDGKKCSVCKTWITKQKVIPKVPKPGKSSITKLTGGKKQITVKFKKVKSIKGYEIQYATNKSMTKNKKVVTVKSSASTKVVKKLKTKTKYWVRIRTYKVVNGKKVYSAWSSKKTVKTK